MLDKLTFHRILLVLGVLWLVIIAAKALVETIKGPAAPAQSASTSTYDRVLKNGVLRCGYVLYPPAVIKDPNDGSFSGIAVEIMDKIATRLNIKVEWTEETSFATNVEGLAQGRYDAVCVTYWQNAAEGKFVGFSTPFYYSGLVGAHKCPEGQLPGENPGPDLESLDDPESKIASIDGSVESRVIAARFPKAGVITLPNLSDVTQLLMNVATGKADVTFAEYYQFSLWNKSNPDMPLCPSPKPISVYPNVIAIPQGDLRFKTMIDAALSDMLNGGEIDAILDKWEADYPNSFYRLAKPYR